MNNLITPEEFAQYRNISEKLNTRKLEEAISLAQQSDLVNILGDFYFDVLANSIETDYQDLMNGSSFVYCEENFVHAGIKALLADYSYARYVYVINVNFTPFGAQNKFTNDSEGVDRNLLKDLAKESQLDAGRKFLFIEKYIMSEPELFSRYCKNKKENTGFFTQKISKL